MQLGPHFDDIVGIGLTDIGVATHRSPSHEEGSNSKLEKAEFTIEKNTVVSVRNENVFILA